MNNLKTIRKERGLTQTDVAKLLNITVSAYGNYELGQRSPTPEVIVQLADIFEVSTDYILGHKTNEIEISELSQFENMLITTIRKLSETDKYQVLGFAKSLAI